jgi:hypothetical protein
MLVEPAFSARFSMQEDVIGSNRCLSGCLDWLTSWVKKEAMSAAEGHCAWEHRSSAYYVL